MIRKPQITVKSSSEIPLLIADVFNDSTDSWWKIRWIKEKISGDSGDDCTRDTNPPFQQAYLIVIWINNNDILLYF